MLFCLFFEIDDWMAVPVCVPDCPRGLEYLCTLDQLLVKQKVSLTEALIGFEANNKYIIKNCLGQNVSNVAHLCTFSVREPYSMDGTFYNSF